MARGPRSVVTTSPCTSTTTSVPPRKTAFVSAPRTVRRRSCSRGNAKRSSAMARSWHGLRAATHGSAPGPGEARVRYMDGLSGRPLHVLVMTDRDWTHPQGGGTGANLFGQVSRWLAWGHRVSVIACSYPGAESFERIGERLELHRMGGRSTVFPRAILAQARG